MTSGVYVGEMSTKTSSPAPVVKIKKEIPSDEIKDFAETAMNELLGWYGYDNVDRIEEQTRTHRLIASGINSTDNPYRNDSNHSNSHHDTSGAHSHESSREDSRSPSSVKNCEKSDTHCGWCKRLVPTNSPEFLTTPEGPRYCSESCFAQSRRASFKRAKTCDWCRHVRHAVSYVDFQDGASQLQFCSDKCLNQYKMQIFCKETQAHLDMNPHLKEKGADMSGGTLITPDLWLKNCRSRSATPEPSDISRSPTPTQKNATSQQPVHKPVISVAPPSKLLSRTQLIENTRQSPKHSRKKRFTRVSVSHNSIGQNGSSSSTPAVSNSSSNLQKLGIETVSNPPIPPKPCTFTNVQDLRMNVPAISPIDGVPPLRPSIPSPFFTAPPPNAFNMHPSFFNNHPHPRLLGLGPQQPMLQMPPMPGTDFSGLFSSLGTTPPPVTVMVPYPIILPLPIPIPIPLPIMDFIKAAEVRKNGAIPSTQKLEPEADVPILEENVEPLDCSKSKPTPPTEEVETQNLSAAESIQLDVENNDSDQGGEEQETVPKLKITRLHSKRAAINPPRELESSRPLRKRKRIIDCDYIKAASKDFEDRSRFRK